MRVCQQKTKQNETKATCDSNFWANLWDCACTCVRESGAAGFKNSRRHLYFFVRSECLTERDKAREKPKVFFGILFFVDIHWKTRFTLRKHYKQKAEHFWMNFYFGFGTETKKKLHKKNNCIAKHTKMKSKTKTNKNLGKIVKIRPLETGAFFTVHQLSKCRFEGSHNARKKQAPNYDKTQR